MTYEVSRKALNTKYTKWRDAMLLELHSALNLKHEMQFTRDYEIDSVLKYNLLISGITGLLHTRFRGEARYHSNPCLPIIARHNAEHKDTAYEIAEVDRFKLSTHAPAFANKLSSSDITWWMLAQHYRGYETRLLDITRNSLVALYFACEKRFDEDGYVYIFHSVDKTAVPLNSAYHSYGEHITDPQEYYYDDQYIYMRPTVALDRINRQEGEFLWIKDFAKLREVGLFETKQIIPILIKKEYKQQLLKELNDPQGINADYLYLHDYYK